MAMFKLVLTTYSLVNYSEAQFREQGLRDNMEPRYEMAVLLTV